MIGVIAQPRKPWLRGDRRVGDHPSRRSAPSSPWRALEVDGPLGPAEERIARRSVREVRVTAAEAAGQEDAVVALDECRELGVGHLAAHDAVAGFVALADPSPIHRAVDEIGAEDDADVDELKALRGADAADLVDP